MTPPSNSTPRLLAVGRLVEAKDYGNLLAAMRRLADRGVEAGLQIAGDGPLRESLERECARLGLQSRVQFLGSRKDVDALLAGADVFVMSSRREGQPLALLEAMAAEKPIVATAVGGVPQTVRDGLEAILVPAEDADSLATALQRVLQQPERAAELGRNARVRALRNFSIEAIAADHLKLYDHLLAEGAP